MSFNRNSGPSLLLLIPGAKLKSQVRPATPLTAEIADCAMQLFCGCKDRDAENPKWMYSSQQPMPCYQDRETGALHGHCFTQHFHSQFLHNERSPKHLALAVSSHEPLTGTNLLPMVRSSPWSGNNAHPLPCTRYEEKVNINSTRFLTGLTFPKFCSERLCFAFSRICFYFCNLGSAGTGITLSSYSLHGRPRGGRLTLYPNFHILLLLSLPVFFPF